MIKIKQPRVEQPGFSKEPKNFIFQTRSKQKENQHWDTGLHDNTLSDVLPACI